MNKPVILTGLRANNDLTIGNYLGALLPIIDMARKRSDEYQVNLFIPDLHSFTTPIDHSQLQAQIMRNLKVFVAAGLPLDIDDVHIYRQSYVPAHSELTWILDCFTGFGEMNRMTQFRDKSKTRQIELQQTRIINEIGEKLKIRLPESKKPKSYSLQELHNHDPEIIEALVGGFGQLYALKSTKEHLEGETTVGLFNYPVLMAADILLYNAQYVPVGDDQTQHLEFTRDIAERLNNQFGELFTVPMPVPKQHEFFGKDQGLRIKDLIDPTKKMSKSDETGRGVIFLSDTPEAAAKKIMGATTDSFGEVKYDVKGRPGISNLLQILALLSGRDLQEVIAQYEGQTSYGDLKKEVATIVGDFLRDFQSKLAEVDEATVLAKLEKDEAAMQRQANATLLKVQRAVGLRP